MTTRILPPDEWHRLSETEAGTEWQRFDPAHAQVLVAEREGVIVGCWVLLTIPHVECLWIAPSERGRSSVGRRLLSSMRLMARAMGAHWVWTAAVSEDVRQLLEHVGARKLNGDHYVMSMEAR